MARNKEKKTEKKQSGTSKALLSAILITAFAIAGAAAYLWFVLYVMRPSLVLGAPETTLEAGDEFDPWTMVKSLAHAEKEQVKITSEGLDTKVPGDYEVTYTLGEESLPIRVHVVDSTPPELDVYEGVYEIRQGRTVSVNDVVLRTEDLGEVHCTFDDGEIIRRYNREGEEVLTVVALDASGNRTEKGVDIRVVSPDQEAPVILGAENTAVTVGEVFDVMEGISVRDDNDPDPEVKAEVSAMNTSMNGAQVIHYSATDSTGKSTIAERIVTAADHVIEYEGQKFGVYWDLTGLEGQPYLVAVNRALNTVTVYQQDLNGQYTVPVTAFVCSTGPTTPLGYFRTLERERWRYLFEDCWGQYATRIEGHILFHSVPYFTQNQGDLEYEEYNLLGTSASLGCIRLSVEDVKWIYDFCPTGFPCVIYEDSVTPGPLGKPVPITIDPEDERRGWDPTDPDPGNPWLLS